MSDRLLPTTQMSVRATAATLAAIVLTRLVSLERPYWVILTAVILVNETWGESVRKAAQRLAWTALGCLAGWLLYDLSALAPGVRPILLIAGVFLAVYFRAGVPAGSYTLMTFFMTVYVVFLFATLGTWSRHLVLERVYDTGLGCAVAVGVSAVVLPRFARKAAAEQLHDFWTGCRDYLARTGEALLTDGAPPPREDRHELLRQLEKLHGAHRASSYEGIFRGDLPDDDVSPLPRAERLCRYTLAVAAAVEEQAARRVAGLLHAPLRQELQAAEVALGRLAETPTDGSEHVPNGPTGGLEPAMRSLLAAGTVSAAELAAFAPVAGYLDGILQVLGELLPARSPTEDHGRRRDKLRHPTNATRDCNARRAG